jgi:16S rRNA (cytosine967-C5)-methyltransferase
MTPGARAAAAIEVLDAVLAGQPVEPALTAWARGHRFAGSGDRLAIRDHVFDALRRRRSLAALGGGETGRGLVLGLFRNRGEEHLFDGQGYAPPPPTPDEAPRPATEAEALDCPDWLLPRLRDSLGAGADGFLRALQDRAPVFLRVNRLKTDPAAALAALAADGIAADPVPDLPTALRVTGNARRIQTARAYLDGLVELQDLSSQALCAVLPLRSGDRVLDYCAGGGGKSLALAARAPVSLHAHDIAPQRMKDLPARAARAGARIALTDRPESLAPFDLILTDVPCSGSGSWRRDPMGKWLLTPERLAATRASQAAILDRCAPWLRPGGVLAYATCSVLVEEDEAQVADFLARSPGWTCQAQHRWGPETGGDGFFLAVLTAPGR